MVEVFKIAGIDGVKPPGWHEYVLKSDYDAAVAARAWEYRVDFFGSAINDWLAKLGSEGWELCAVVGDSFYFKRPARQEGDRP